jgi:hypothetical protein
MTDDLLKKINTAGAFDTPWLKQMLQSWDAFAELCKAEFMEHMYQCSGRQDPTHPEHGLYTGLWQNFCINEAGPVMRDRYFEMLEVVRIYEEQAAKVKAELVLA